MNLKKKYSSLFITMLLIITNAVTADCRTKQNTFNYTIGADIAINKRNGYYFFESVNKMQKKELPVLMLYGVSLGRRFPFPVSWLGMEWDIGYNYGRNRKNLDFLYYKNSFSHLWFSMDIHCNLLQDEFVNFFIPVGGSLNYMHLNQAPVISDPVMIQDPPNNIDIRGWSPGVNIGSGIDLKLSKTAGLTLKYSFHFWRPVKFLDKRELLYESISYKEYFFTSLLQVRLLFNLENPD